MSKFTVVVLACGLGLAAANAYAQGPFGPKGDLALGFGTIEAPSSSSATGNYIPQTQAGGLYSNFTVDFLLHHKFGVGGEIAWRWGRNLYLGYEPFRPIFYDINGIYAPRLGKKLGLQLSAGIGAESIRFYSGQYNCNFVTCTDYVSSNHFMGHFGAGIKIYAHGNFFIRPEADLYLIHNNFDFSGGYATHVGTSLGYTF